MYETKSEVVHAERVSPARGPMVNREFEAKTEVDQGNEAILLRVNTAANVELKLAKDGHVRTLRNPEEFPPTHLKHTDCPRPAAYF
jgi:hypothetical protein